MSKPTKKSQLLTERKKIVLDVIGDNEMNYREVAAIVKPDGWDVQKVMRALYTDGVLYLKQVKNPYVGGTIGLYRNKPYETEEKKEPPRFKCNRLNAFIGYAACMPTSIGKRYGEREAVRSVDLRKMEPRGIPSSFAMMESL